MPKKVKTSTPVKVSDVETADPLDTTVEVVDAKQPAKVKKAKKTTKKPVVVEIPTTQVGEVVAEPVVDDANVDADTVPEPSGAELVSSVMNEFSNTLTTLTAQLSTLRGEFKSLTKTVAREMKAASKSSRRKRTGGNKQPSGFVKPTPITDELAVFLGREKGSEMARTEVTKEINQYVRDQKLQDSENGRHINPDKKLSKLLGYTGEEVLTYFNLQKYLSPHFLKTSV